jgi:hypothetical protein
MALWSRYANFWGRILLSSFSAPRRLIYVIHRDSEHEPRYAVVILPSPPPSHQSNLYVFMYMNTEMCLYAWAFYSKCQSLMAVLCTTQFHAPLCQVLPVSGPALQIIYRQLKRPSASCTSAVQQRGLSVSFNSNYNFLCLFYGLCE